MESSKARDYKVQRSEHARVSIESEPGRPTRQLYSMEWPGGYTIYRTGNKALVKGGTRISVALLWRPD